MIIKFLLALLTGSCVLQGVPLLDLFYTRVWGPGIQHADVIAMHNRYFFIEPRDSNNTLIMKRFKYDIEVMGKSRRGDCNVSMEQIDRYDGSSIIIYSLIETCWHFTIHVCYKGRHLGLSPFVFRHKLFAENCHCPQYELKSWLYIISCPLNQTQVDNDLFPFQTVNYTALRPKIMRQYIREGIASLCHYVVSANKVYRKCFGDDVGLKIYMDKILLSLARKVHMPELELFVNVGRRPVVTKGRQGRYRGPSPIFSWCGSNDTFDIVMPSYDLLSTLDVRARNSRDMFSVQYKGLSWKRKIAKGFWQGPATSQARLDLADLSRRNPTVINASLTNFFLCPDQQKKYGLATVNVSFKHYVKHKYLIVVDSLGAPTELPYMLAGTSVVFKQESNYYEHFYRKLQREVHYVPIKKDLSNLVNRIEQARHTEAQILKIRDNAKAFANENLFPLSIYCYYGHLLSQFADNIISDIEVLPYMELVKPKESDCVCSNTIPDYHEDL